MKGSHQLQVHINTAPSQHHSPHYPGLAPVREREAAVGPLLFPAPAKLMRAPEMTWHVSRWQRQV